MGVCNFFFQKIRKARQRYFSFESIIQLTDFRVVNMVK